MGGWGGGGQGRAEVWREAALVHDRALGVAQAQVLALRVVQCPDAVPGVGDQPGAVHVILAVAVADQDFRGAHGRLALQRFERLVMRLAVVVVDGLLDAVALDGLRAVALEQHVLAVLVALGAVGAGRIQAGGVDLQGGLGHYVLLGLMRAWNPPGGRMGLLPRRPGVILVAHRVDNGSTKKTLGPAGSFGFWRALGHCFTSGTHRTTIPWCGEG